MINTSKKAVPATNNKVNNVSLPQGFNLAQLLGAGPQPLIYNYKGKPDEHHLPRSSYMIWIVGCMLLSFFIWAYFSPLDEVAVGQGKVIPSSGEQWVQSFEGGILENLYVREGDIVEQGQIVAKLDPIKTGASVAESRSRMLASMAEAARLTSEVNDTILTFPSELNEVPELIEAETRLYNDRRKSLESSLDNLKKVLSIAQQERSLLAPLLKSGAASQVDLLRLERQIIELNREINSAKNDYLVKARESLSRANAEVEAQKNIVLSKEDALKRLEMKSPVRGIIKKINVTTIGGVLPHDGKLMEIVPIDEKLLVEARIMPNDIAFIRVGLHATVKVTAYDYSIYGGLKGKVSYISPDTIQDEVRRDQFYYKVHILTDEDFLVNKLGKKFTIVPGMITTTDIHTGNKTVLEYLVKPFNKLNEALRQR